MSTALIIIACLSGGALAGLFYGIRDGLERGYQMGVQDGRRYGFLRGRKRHQHPLAARYWDNPGGDS